MDSKQAWEIFMKTGRMQDYMMYRATLGGQMSPPPQAASARNVTPENDRPTNLTTDRHITG